MTARSDVHPSDSDLQSYTQGKLDAATLRSLIDHLDECPACRKRAAELPDHTLNVREGVGRAPVPPTAKPPAAPPTGQPAAAAPHPPAGVPPELAEHPNYEVLKELGRGGMGVVYLARNLLMDRLEVLKVMSKELVGRKDAVERFVQEIRSAARLNHPNVVTAYTTLLLGDLLVLAMEYVEGEDLGKVVKAKGRLPVPFSCFCVREAALGLQRGHELGLVHRDIKPGNLILSRQGKRSVVKIVDFGLAKAKAEAPVDHGLTPTNQMMGTLGYTAPEQLRDAKSADTRADIYSLGCTLYFLLAGGVPFKGNSAYEVFLAQEAAEVEPLQKLRPDVPEDLAAVVKKMMSKNPADRYAEPAEVARALFPFLKQGGSTAPGKEGIQATPAPSDRTLPDGGGVPVARLLEPAEPDSKTQRITADLPPEPEPPDTLRESRRERRARPAGRDRRVKKSAPIGLLIGLVIGGAMLAGAMTLVAVLLFRERPPADRLPGDRPADEHIRDAQGPAGQLPPGETVIVDGVPPDIELDIEGQPTLKSRNGSVVTVTGVRPGPRRLLANRNGQTVWSTDLLIDPRSEPVRISMPPPPEHLPPAPRPSAPPPRQPPPKGPPPRPGFPQPGDRPPPPRKS